MCDTQANLYSDGSTPTECKSCEVGKFAFAEEKGISGGSTCKAPWGSTNATWHIGFSLGTWVIRSDPRMHALDTAGDNTAAAQMLRLEGLLRDADIDGDNYLSRAELQSRLRDHEVIIDKDFLQRAPLWCNPLTLSCLEGEKIPVLTVYDETRVLVSGLQV
jgi:hypothetical protein